MPSILLVVKHAIEARCAAERMAKIERDTMSSDDISKAGSKSAPGATAPGDARKLRGIPAIGRGVTGAIAGTTAHDAIARADYHARASSAPSDAEATVANVRESE